MKRSLFILFGAWLGFGLLSEPAAAQVDLSGVWRTIRHEDLPDRGPGVGLGDYTGIPLTDAARQWAESWDASRLTMQEQQCRVHVSPYIYRGPMNLRIWEEKDPKTQEVIAIKHYISTYEQTRTIWMDGRPHPPAHAPHTWMGFSTGKWSGDRLTVETTHIKQGWHRRNGVPSSDQTTLTEHYIRHGNLMTHIAVIRDPVYLTEPMVKSQHFEINPRGLPPANWLWPCTRVVEVAERDPHAVPHYLPGKNPHLAPSRTDAKLPSEGAAGGPETVYPEWADGREKRRLGDAASRPRGAPEQARAAAPAGNEIQIWPIRPNVFMLVGAGGNTTVQVGDEGALVVDTMRTEMSDRLIAAIKTLSSKPIRYIINTHADEEHLGGNGAVSKAGATRTGGVVVAQIGAGITEKAAIIAHEKVLERVSAPTGQVSTFPSAVWPTQTFFQTSHDFAFNGEGVILTHQPAAHTDGDIIVFLRRSDVISAGDVFSTTSYPVIETERGGTIQGVIAALNQIIDIAVPDVDQQGGTMIVPGHGRLSDEMDVVEYRDMVTIVRDRVQDMINRGMTLEQVRAARPTFDFDARYGAETGRWTTTMFVDAVYNTLKAAKR